MAGSIPLYGKIMKLTGKELQKADGKGNA